MITVLTGGTGGAKFVEGLQQVIAPEDLTLIVNTGDDLLWWGLYVSPDIDSITYVLSGMLSKERGWGNWANRSGFTPAIAIWRSTFCDRSCWPRAKPFRRLRQRLRTSWA